jgi:predicted TIM-barrel fold metal-dependent hydrolase
MFRVTFRKNSFSFTMETGPLSLQFVVIGENTHFTSNLLENRLQARARGPWPAMGYPHFMEGVQGPSASEGLVLLNTMTSIPNTHNFDLGEIANLIRNNILGVWYRSGFPSLQTTSQAEGRTMKKEPNRIDVHFHIIPQPYVSRLAKEGVRGSTYVDFPGWTPESALVQMDRDGIRTAITSLSTPGVWFGDRALARQLSRSCNEFQARMVDDHPARFGSLASLPLPDTEGALLELEYALDTLGHDGVCLLSDVAGRYLGHPDYEELFSELDRRRAVVFIHPNDDPREEKRYELFSPLLEWPVHTTGAVLDLLYSGRLARFPGIRYILAHGGGTLPALAHRAIQGKEAGWSARGWDGLVPSLKSKEPDTGLVPLQRLYFDTAAPGETHLATLKELAGPGQLLFGTDGGWTPPIQTALTVKSFLDHDGFDDEERWAIEEGNASLLFPRVARPGPGAPSPGRGKARVRSPSAGFTLPKGGVDIHHHAIPPFYLGALEAEGIPTEDLPAWSPQASIEALGKMGREKALLSVAPPGVWFGNPGKARKLARQCNEYLASLRAGYPGSFGGLASLPFPDLEGSLGEVEYALDTLELEGVLLFSNVEGHYPGDPDFEPLLEALHEREAQVLLHPNGLPPSHANAALYPGPEYPLDLARSYVRLVLGDAFVRYPRIRWVLSHGGGPVPFLAERLGKAHYVKNGKLRWWRILRDMGLKRNGGLELIRGIGIDTADVGGPESLTPILRLVPAEKVHFGSNFPWSPPQPPVAREEEVKLPGEEVVS